MESATHLKVQQRLEQGKRDREEKLAQIHEKERENKADDEDWQTIDSNFNKKFEKLEIELAEWSTQCEDDKTKIEEYFTNIFSEFKELREYVYTYTFAIPAYNFT